MHSHLWIMSKMLSMYKSPGKVKAHGASNAATSNRILYHVIATCYPKMNRRMKHSVSETYMQCLEEIKTFDISTSMVQDTPSEVQLKSDRRFLSEYLLPCKDILNNLGIKTSKLEAQASLAIDGKAFQLYTIHTSIEFHQLFVGILKAFGTALDKLAETRGTTTTPTIASSEFRQQVSLVSLHGFALQRLGKGAVLRAHLKNISALLQEKINAKNPPPKRDEKHQEKQQEKQHADDQADDQADDRPDDLDEEFAEARPFTSKAGEGPIPLWLSCIDWTRLVISHFDAVDGLVGFVTGKNFTQKRISVEIVAASPPDTEFLQWKLLFSSPTLLPALSLSPSTETHSDGQTNNKLFEFLDQAVTHARLAKQAHAAWKKKNASDTVSYLQKLKATPLGIATKPAEDALVHLALWKSSPNDQLFDIITGKVLAVCETVQLFTFMGDPRDLPTTFQGAVHCETILASLLDKATYASDELSTQMQVFTLSPSFDRRTLISYERALDQSSECRNVAAQPVTI